MADMEKNDDILIIINLYLYDFTPKLEWIHTSYLSLIFGFSSNLQVSAVALCPDNSQLVSGTRDGRVVLWCLESYSIIQVNN